jgi:hypothetical protein
MRPMSDEEWFSSLASAKPKPTPTPDTSLDNRSNITTPHPSTPASSNKKGHTRTASDRIVLPDHSRSRSASSMGSLNEENELINETVKRRKRDSILGKISRRGDKMKVEVQEEGHRNTEADGVKREARQRTPGVDGGGGELEDDDQNSGQYVNYQVGFRYDRTTAASRRGFGLHMLVSRFCLWYQGLKSSRHISAGVSRVWRNQRSVGIPDS